MEMTRPARCWCGRQDLSPFSAFYSACPCGTLVDLAKPSGDITRVTDESELYGSAYYLEHLPRDYGFPTLSERARVDMPERNTFWLRTLLRYRLPPARVLELGSSHGGFVALAAAAGFDITGLELSPWLTAHVEEAFGQPLLTGPLEDQAILPHSLDMIVLMDVLEHLPDPVGTMRLAASLLKPDGMFIIQTPRYQPEVKYAELKDRQDTFLLHLKEVEHLFLFSPASATELMRQVGFPQVVFEEAIFRQYDMFFLASRTPLAADPWEQVEKNLMSRRNGRVVLALLDLDTLARDRQASLVKLSVEVRALRDESRRMKTVVVGLRKSRLYRWMRRLGRWAWLHQAIEEALSSDRPEP